MKICDITFLDIVKQIVNSIPILLKIAYIIIVLFVVGTAVFFHEIIFLRLATTFIVLCVTLIWVYSLHEYIHVLSIKKFDQEALIKIQSKTLFISIQIVNGQISNRKSIFIAAMPNVLILCLGLFSMSIYFFTKIDIIKYISLLHIVTTLNLLPFFGDGKIILMCLKKEVFN